MGRHTIEDFHDDDVWRDEDGTVWVRQAELVARVVELEAVIQKVRSMTPTVTEWGVAILSVAQTAEIQAMLRAAPSVVLADHDKEVAAQAIERIDVELQQQTVFAKPYEDWKGDMTKKQRRYGRGYVSGLAEAFRLFRQIADSHRLADQNGEHA